MEDMHLCSELQRQADVQLAGLSAVPHCSAHCDTVGLILMNPDSCQIREDQAECDLS